MPQPDPQSAPEAPKAGPWTPLSASLWGRRHRGDPWPTRGDSHRWQNAAWALTLVGVLYFVALVFHQFYAFESTDELASFQTILHNTLQGRFLAGSPDDHHFFGIHFSPILLLILPLYALHTSPLTLLLIHGIVAGLAVYPLWRLAEIRLSRSGRQAGGLALAIAACYLLSRVVNYGVLYAFHMEIFYPLFFFWAFVFAEREQWKLFALALLLALTVKEDAAIAGFGLGLYLLSRGWRRQGLLSSGFCMLWLLLAVLVLIPAFNTRQSQDGWGFVNYWSSFGETRGEVLTNMLNPLNHVRVLFSPEKLSKCFNVFSVFVFLPLLSWRGLLFLVGPSWFILYSADNPLLWGLAIYYGLLITPFLFYASLDGLDALGGWARGRRWVVTGAIVLMLLVNLGNARLWRHIKPSFWSLPERVATANDLVGRIPVGEAVSAQIRIRAHLPVQGNRFLLPGQIDRADWLLFDLEGDPYPVTAEENRQLMDTMLDSPEWRLVERKDGYVLLKRSVPRD